MTAETAPKHEERVNEIAKAVCSARCFRAEVMGKPCVLPDGRNGPCQITSDQVILSWVGAAAKNVSSIAASPTSKGAVDAETVRRVMEAYRKWAVSKDGHDTVCAMTESQYAAIAARAQGGGKGVG